MNPNIRKNSSFSNKIKNFVEKTKLQHVVKNDHSSETDDTPMTEKFVFTPADQNLEKSFQARENLANFKRFLDSHPDDPMEAFQLVQQSLLDAFAELADKTVVLKTKLENSQISNKEIDAQIKEKEEIRLNLERQVRNNNGEIRQLKIQYHALKDETENINNQLKKTEKYKMEKNKFSLLYQDLLSQKLQGKSNYEQSKIETSKLEKELESAKLQFDEQKIKMEEEVQKSETQVKDLANKAKKADQIEKSLASKPKQENVEKEPKKTAFVINDNVKVSNEEIKQLKLMIESIQRENNHLTEERNSKMMDIDCIMQENLGLKQIIRKMTEG
ncbi:hypothetical protein M9Y10_009643 [Tritrichomonas musculus]|uniref:Uncharacterized protein n=1 Tax=Tritrichomonas musculus TaxID=1915356 RepID=A0ABR2IP28_9EUKA